MSGSSHSLLRHLDQLARPLAAPHLRTYLTMRDSSGMASGTAFEYVGGFATTDPAVPHMDATESRALVVEDTELGRWALGRALEAAGLDVVAVPTWDEASVLLRESPFSLALVAVSSIPTDVTDVATAIRRDHPDTHLILLTEEDASDDDFGAIRRLGVDLLPKPFDLEEVAQVAHLRSGRVA